MKFQNNTISNRQKILIEILLSLDTPTTPPICFYSISENSSIPPLYISVFPSYKRFVWVTNLNKNIFFWKECSKV